MPILYKISRELEEIVPSFLKTRLNDASRLKEFLSAENFEELRSIGHKVKGTAGSYEFMALSEIGARIEQAAKNEDLKELKCLVEEYESHIKKIEIEYI